MEDHIIAAHRVPLLFKFCGKEFSLLDPGQKDMVALPEVEVRNVLVRDPFQPPLGRVDLFTLPASISLAFLLRYSRFNGVLVLDGNHVKLEISRGKLYINIAVSGAVLYHWQVCQSHYRY